MPKTLKQCTLLDRFLFDQTMDCPEAHEAALQIILNDPGIRLLTPAQTEKELRTAPWLRSIRLDVFALDENASVYNTEMQKGYRTDLEKRSRYYQSLIDSSLLEPGSLNFNQLNNTYIILIMPFDSLGSQVVLDALRHNIPVYAVKENATVLDITPETFLSTCDIINTYNELMEQL